MRPSFVTRDRRTAGSRGLSEAWTSVTTLLTGMAVWGLAGYGLDRLLGTRPVAMAAGVVVGMFGAVYLIYIRALRSEEQSRAA